MGDRFCHKVPASGTAPDTRTSIHRTRPRSADEDSHGVLVLMPLRLGVTPSFLHPHVVTSLCSPVFLGDTVLMVLIAPWGLLTGCHRFAPVLTPARILPSGGSQGVRSVSVCR